MKRIFYKLITKNAAKCYLLGACFISCTLFAATGDILAPAKTTIDATFGPNSTGMHIIYLLEFFTGAGAYIVTKSVKVLWGVPVIMVVSAIVSALMSS